MQTGERLGDVALITSARYFLGVIHHARGDYQDACGALQPVRDALVGGLTSGRFGTAAATTIFATSYLASSLAERGRFAEGRGFAEEAMRLAEPLHHPFLLVHAYVAFAAVDLRRGAVEDVVPRLEQLRAIRSTGNFPVVFPANEWFLGYAYALAGRAEGLPLLERLAGITRSAGVTFYLPLWIAMLAEAYVLGGRPGDALPPARQALALARQRGERGHEGWSLRLIGDVHLEDAALDLTAAERAYREALAIADARGMEPLRAHCHRGLGRIARRQGRAQRSRRTSWARPTGSIAGWGCPAGCRRRASPHARRRSGARQSSRRGALDPTALGHEWPRSRPAPADTRRRPVGVHLSVEGEPIDDGGRRRSPRGPRSPGC